MTSERNTCNFNSNNDNLRRSCILETLRKIDQSQKEAVIESDCVGCGGTLITKTFDTKPVIFTLEDDSKFTAFLGLSNDTTNLFRVEEVMNDCVLCRALERVGAMVRCTRFTCILQINCICGLQCLDPINCQVTKGERCNFSD
jgi:hypothetical protein